MTVAPPAVDGHEATAKDARSSTTNPTPWSPLELWSSYLLIHVLAFGVYRILRTPLRAFAIEERGLYEVAWLETYLLILWIVLLYFVRRKGISWFTLGVKPFRTRALLAILPGFFVVMLAVHAFNATLLPTLPRLQAYQATLDLYLDAPFSWPVVDFMVAVIAAPVVEELLFRGLLFTGFRGYIGIGKAAVLTAVLFSLWHTAILTSPFAIHLHPSQALGAFFIGLVFAGMRQDSDSVFPSMLAHAAWNWMLFVS